MKTEFVLANEAQALQLAEVFARFRPASAVVYLRGDLGTGKTTFSRGFIQAAGHPGKVKSPTYTLVESYDLASGMIQHLDLYRLSDPEELEYLGIHELTQQGICLIEWPQRGEGVIPLADLTLEMIYEGNGRRLFAGSHNPLGESWLADVQSHSPL